MIIPEFLSFATLIICFVTVLFLFRYAGKSGLLIYSALATIIANLQVLKLTQYALLDSPVALGTVVFSTTFAVDNILTECYGKNVAKKCIWTSFSSYLFFVICMKMAVLHPPVNSNECVDLHSELQKLFSPGFILFISSLISYVVGQFSDVTIFSFLKKIFNNKFITLRSLMSMSISTFIDNFVFSICAWYIFAEHPVSFATLWKTYVFMNYIIRLIVAVCCVPLVKLAVVNSESKDVQKF